MRYVSVFSGIEAASVAWEPLGFEPMAFSEVDPHASAVLAERFPDVPNLGDITKVDWGGFLESNGAPDVLVGGSPCQSFSIAGKREGLDGASGLMFEYVRAVQELRPRWFVWENVPGALSSTGGADFGCLLDAMDKLGYGMAWRVLDAQFFGVAQRRRRVFLVGCLGDPVGPAEVLFEREGLRRDTPSSKAKREELAAPTGEGAMSAGFCAAATAGTGSIGFEPELHPTLKAGGNLAGTGAVLQSVPHAEAGLRNICMTTANTKAKGSNISEDGVAYTLDRSNSNAVCVQEPMLGRSDANSGTNEGMNVQPCVAYAMRMRQGKPGGGKGPLVQDDVSGTLATSNDQTIFCRAGLQVNSETCEDMAPTLSARQYKDPHVTYYERPGGPRGGLG